jgi:hypothetical protein
VLGNFERTLRHIIDFKAEVAILAEVRQDPRVVMIPYPPFAICECPLRAVGSTGQRNTLIF